MLDQSLTGGFSTPATQSASAFRAALNVMARPGTIEQMTGATAPAPCSPAAATLLLTLCDAETPIHLAGSHDAPDLRGWIAFHIGAPIVAAPQAAFALGTWGALPLSAFPIGTPEYPDRSTTLIVEMPELTNQGVRLTGPGIRDSAHLNLPDPAFFQMNSAAFPLGLDSFFTAGNALAALPRSTQIKG